jgi:uridine kinase
MSEGDAKRPFVVAIAGGSATGKSTLAKALAAALADLNPVILNQDRFFRDFAEYTPEERERVRTANSSNAMNWSAYHDALAGLIAGRAVTEPTSGTRAAQRGEGGRPIEPGGILIVEGLFALWDEPTREAADLKLFTEIDDDERVLRRIYRDITERNGELMSIMAWYRRDVKPNFPTFTLATKVHADLIVPSNHPFDIPVSVLAPAIRAMKAEREKAG